ncbi:MAG: hypothetical protein ABIS59_02480, partial [Candidatus Saccharibacteria bacterium]
MKIPSKIAIVALSLNLLIPTASLAQGGDDSTSGTSHIEASSTPEVHSTDASRSPRPSESPKGKGGDVAKFCTNIGTSRTSVTGDTDKKIEKLKDEFTQHKGEISAKRTQLTKSLAEKRTKADIERTERFKALETKAKTDAQIVAIKAYETSVLAAVAKHRAAVDAADKTFVDGVATAVGTRQTDLSSAIAAYKASVSA